ncbi:3-hydroxyacyl-CoA dehydrogenase [Staphylococcus schleiferi]|uniref:thioesterase family protein n=1 Tax=Staphylococcus coagulans TaxID=74706 RepID=UPI00067A2AFB|nr:thioesterase family protein [Staphylococcus coagulans]AKS68515.1 3-hydroxyacyl-CoA dehydrogenase [Staphylococcus schleiferi]AKS70743.1 3-hydroxyacyl-CoA dehydrogenase [Staphylococcus schleiferi]AKS72910.1 3-hydroxyacyl-CoA dehydrogenase [Staphylococcus schleiferi]MBT2833250.1 thioesterase [Staphylococcus coagulans]
MIHFPFYDENSVQEDWIDRNQHMNDSEYARVFSLAIDHFHDQIGLSNPERNARNYTVFTLETHISFLKELSLHTPIAIKVNIYDFNEKRTHYFLELINRNTNEVVATAETMMMGIDKSTRRAAPYPEDIFAQIQHYVHTQNRTDWPNQLGHRIEIPKKRKTNNEEL